MSELFFKGSWALYHWLHHWRKCLFLPKQPLIAYKVFREGWGLRTPSLLPGRMLASPVLWVFYAGNPQLVANFILYSFISYESLQLLLTATKWNWSKLISALICEHKHNYLEDNLMVISCVLDITIARDSQVGVMISPALGEVNSFVY